MEIENKFGCFLIGADTLLIECGEILLRRGHQIRGVISSMPRIGTWAQQAGIAVLDPKSDYHAGLAEQPYDYFFSITHLSIVPDGILNTAGKCAINFHDGPLPRYAGINAPAWALMNRESSYGITWHVMTAGVDRGDILKQALFEIAPDETSLTLNTKCFEAGIETFAELVDELAAGTAVPRPQDDTERVYFGKHERPNAACVLDWSRPAEDLEALVRALDFGRYPNPLGAAKVQHGDDVFVVTSAEVVHDAECSEAGTVVAVDERGIQVSASDGVLNLSGFAMQCGRAISPTELAARLKLQPGDRFDSLKPEVSERLTIFNAGISKSEAFWVKRLENLDPVEIPYRKADAGDRQTPRHVDVQFEIPQSFCSRFESERCSDALLAAFGVFLARCGDKNCFDVAYRYSELRQEAEGLTAWVADYVPLRIDVTGSESFETNLEKLTAQLDKTGARRTWLRDVLGRYPGLRNKSGLHDGRLLPVTFEQCDDLDSFKPSDASAFTLVVASDITHCRFVYDANILTDDAIAALQQQFTTFLESIADDPSQPVDRAELLSSEERQRMLVDWNQTEVDYPRDACVHHLFEEQAERTPDATAVVFEDESLTYRQLNERANQLAAYLQELGIGPDRMVGVCVERSMDLMVSILGTMKAGGAYVPLDPEFPRDRIAFMIEDASAPVLITQDRLVSDLPKHSARVVRVDADWPEISSRSSESVASDVDPSHLAYVIYTSGSTGKPKGVMVEHRNVVNFIVGMDECIPHDPPGTWLAVTSLSFDISVLELFWTLARGFKVVLYADSDRGSKPAPSVTSERGMQYGLFMWGNDDAEGRKKYDLMLNGSRYFDENGFSSVWTPERHFHAFGGPYPNPSVTGAAIAAITSRIQIRAGSCVSPLHHPIRIAEEWSVVDNISDGRVGLSFAAGWNPNDFVLMPENHKNNKAIMFEQIETVRRLWRGESISLENPYGKTIEVTTLPRPVQSDLPIWVTTAGNPETYRQAGQIGAHLLTHLLGQSVEEVAGKIRIYREALAEHGYDPAQFTVSLMLHTFVGENDDEVRELVREPMKDYLRSSVFLVKNFAWEFPAFKRPEGVDSKPEDIDIESLSEEELDAILEFAFERYFENSGLFGTVETCLHTVEKLKAIDVDEIACLLDFGVPTQQVMDSLPMLNELRKKSNAGAETATAQPTDFSLPAQIRRHQVTHLQCTPSMARMLVSNDESREALRQVEHFLIGGEAFPVDLAAQLDKVYSGNVTNMYGPTETTIWSTTQRVVGSPDLIPIGRPIANTQLYILDDQLRPVPAGMPGEFYIAGDGVVRGYHHRPELTAERFVPNPFADDSESRMYRTGDLARYQPDGVVEFLGRTDYQVKIRGYRIELGEIETVLNRHPSVREAVVVAREDVAGDQRLVAYVVAETEPAQPSELREHLREKLPEYMIPSNFVTMDALPLTPNGKIDRKALPAPGEVATETETVYVAPASELQTQIAAIWQETLSSQQIGIDDNFFDIGGHSLLVVRMHRKLRETVEQPISLTDLYRFPTIRSLSEFLSSDGPSPVLEQSANRAERRRSSMRRRRKVTSR